MDTLPPTRKVELIISEVNVTGPCCSCGTTDGVLKCSRCKAISYCGLDCQKKGWDQHRKTCKAIHQFSQKTTAAIDALANCYGGTAALLEAPLMKRGQFDIPSDIVIHDKEFGSFQLRDKYVKARWSLAEAYAKCGQETSSKLSFRLAVENILDMLCLSRDGPASALEVHLLKACTWMVAGDMDQLALNLICYFACRGQARSPRPSPYLDLSLDEDIEGDFCIIVAERNAFLSLTLCFPKMWFHTFMLISLIKVKRIHALKTQNEKEKARWNAFLEGTHPETGDSSVVLKLRGMDLITEKLKYFVLDQSIDERVDLLAEQINFLVEKVNMRNPKLIPGVLDRKTLEDPTFPDWKEDQEFLCNFEYSEYRTICGSGKSDRNTYTGLKCDIHTARYAANMYGYAWNMDEEYANALRLFLDMMTQERDTCNEIAEEKDTANLKAGEKDTGSVKSEEKDTCDLMADRKDTGNMKGSEENKGRVMADEKDTGDMMVL